MKIVEPKQSDVAKEVTRKRYLMIDRQGRQGGASVVFNLIK